MRDTILQAATDIIEADGHDFLQARALAAAANCSVGSIYNHFGDLNGVLLAVNATTLQLLEICLSERIAAEPNAPAADRLNAFGESYLKFAMAHIRRWRTLFDQRLADRAEESASTSDDYANIRALVEDVLKDQLSDPRDRACAARAVFGAIHGNVALALDGRNGPCDADAAVGQIAFVVDCFVRAMTHPRPG
ncbi:MAG: TetR/AcrR family transcriptional regulator [Hyphomicrobiaceae bacterium]|nr:TetR/AcrR family transcriptional regulator [Hyphomicrobiaceae bacterium]